MSKCLKKNNAFLTKLEILVDHAQNRGEPKNFAFY